MTTFRIIERRVSYGEALIEAASHEEAMGIAQTYSDENYDDFEWTDDGRTNYSVVEVAG